MASADDYAAWIVKNQDKKGTPEFETVAQAYRVAKAGEVAQEPTKKFDPSEGEGEFQIGPIHTGVMMPQALTRGLAAAGKAYSDLGTGVEQVGARIADWVSPRKTTLTDLVVNGGKPTSRVEEMQRQVAQTRGADAPLMSTTAGKVGNLGGNLALALPATLIPGANTIAGGAVVGSVQGLLQPSASTEEGVVNTALGGLLGGATPLVSQGLRTLKSASEPFFQKGRDLIVGRALNRAAGSDAPAAANRLATAAELVPGSKPNVGQAAENAGVAALQRAAGAVNPEVTTALERGAAAQNDARVEMLKELAGTNGARDFAAAERDATAQQLYGNAFKNGIPAAAMTPEAQANIAAFQARMPPEVIDYAKKLAQINGQPLNDANSVQGLHWIKTALDGLISKAKASGDGTLARAYTNLQGDFLSGLDKLSPDYEAARKVFATMSRPVNQMDVAQELLSKSQNPLTGVIQPSAFARSLSDPKLAARATGFNGATLENTLEPEQINALQALLKDVQRSSYAQNAGRGAGSDSVQKLAYANILDQSGVPNFLREFAPAQLLGNVGSRAADVAYSRANRELGNQLAEVMLDPKAAAELMKRATPAQKNALLELVKQGSSYASFAAPAIANAQKE